MVIMDYVQLIEPREKRDGENRVQEIDSILKQLRAIAKQFNCAVLGLAQLKREVDSRSEKRPTKADFREFGGFEQEAAVI
ncbi:DnaB-like helicase C-terminal domain-containing protein [Nostoc sp. LEGE 12450]|uniref:DnaB-like helicase C-terminal domain-containing protein n=1 Tax=Nostoc sp. LEGE 12450 TaxID=1828643 RepID=UPI001D154958|nr:DnaB-like helicase C-terminal domain-containing protein [Nostoc sp. LEGE 12450]